MLKTYMPILLIAVLCISCHGGHPVTFESPKPAWKVMKTTKNHVCRRSAYIYLSAQEGEREEAWRWAILSADPVIRRDAVSALFRLKGDEGARMLLEMAPEKDMLVIEALKTVIRHVESPELRRQLSAKVVIPTAAAKVGEDGVPFRQNIRLQDDPTYDHEIATVDKISLAQEKWRIQTDPDNKGIEKKLFAMDLQDSDWKPIAVDRNWEPQGLTDYDGHAWYRVTFKAPPKGDAVGAEILFPLVDEEAWIWLNGTYVGQRANGPGDWSKPFYMNITQEIRWGEDNQLTIRVFDSEKAGGICVPPELHTLK